MSSGAKPRIFISREIPAVGLDRLTELCEADVWRDPLPPSRETLLERIAGCDGVLTMLTERVDAEFFDAAGPQLKVVSNYAVGFNNINVEEASRRGVRVGNTPEVLTEATANMAVCLLLATSRRILEAADYVRSGHWKTWEPLGHIGLDLEQQTLGIVGMGRIGCAVAKRCRGGWNMRVLYNDQRRNEQAEQELDAVPVNLDTLLAESDFVSVHTVLNDTTREMFDATAFAKMKPTAVFINAARGPLHNQSDLYDALKSGEIFAAGLDVTDPEPIAMDDPLLSLPNCLIVPHIASATVASRNGMAEIASDNLLAGLDEKPLQCPVNPEAV